MNRFRTKKKGRDDAFIVSRPSMEAPEPSGPFRMFSKKKSQEDEPKRHIDLAAALPPSDDFRTSLLMTGLSARFSMLREQDDPNSKLGKASDDSVLFPKRQSRLPDFGAFGGGLDDIAEIESLKAPHMGRFDSYQSDDACSTTGSIMGRAKPIEGNNLFGGRQKIYKLTAGSKAGMTGRALYDDDVAQSSFQKWRQAERERKSLEESQNAETLETEPISNYNQRRETSSTTSSIPSGARNSTAATSIASQPSSIKDTQQPNINLASQERNVTRTRRLYEQGLTQDLQDQQSSAASRMDTLSRQRPFGSRTPDPASRVTPSSTTMFGERVTDRRSLLSKASAPNLRSFSPSTMGSSQASPVDSTNKFPRQESAPSFGASPPLSPPISETEELPALAIQPNDRGKATAMGVFNRPAMQYDESRYAQRQRQLQQGRDPSTSRYTAESAASSVGARSRSSSSQRPSTERSAPVAALPEIPTLNENYGSTFFDESDDGSVDLRTSSVAPRPPQLTIERPSDRDHPAFRKSALPTPLSLMSPRDSEDGRSLSPGSRTEPPEDSPTLGPNHGLSGMVRQHLRNVSTASSVYGQAIEEGESYGPDTNTTPPVEEKASTVNDENAVERDDFAQHLAEGARRVRERLTTYVESDNERSAPPTPQSDFNQDLASSRPGNLGMLRSTSSRGSLFDKAEKERGRSKTVKSPTPQLDRAGTSPSPQKMSSSPEELGHREISAKADEAAPVEKEENVHVGLKAFRQARRELQKMKELEVQQRHAHKTAPSQERPPNSRVTSYENGPPPAIFNRMPRDGENYGGRSRAGSRAASERDRSGSETSNGGRAFSRGPRLRNGSATFEEHYGRQALGGSPGPDARRQPMESPSLSPYMGNGSSPVGVSPSQNAFEAPGRYYSPAMQSPQQFDAPSYTKSRNGNSVGAASSTPNLPGGVNAPPLPPINPRRKNGFARRSDESPGPVPHHGVLGMAEGYVGDDDSSTETYRGRIPMTGPHNRHSPPRMVRPGMPSHSPMSNNSLPGGMI